MEFVLSSIIIVLGENNSLLAKEAPEPIIWLVPFLFFLANNHTTDHGALHTLMSIKIIHSKCMTA